MSDKIFVVYFYIGPYDGQGGNRVFSTLDNAVKYCALQPEAKMGHPKNPFKDDPHGWVIEEQVLDAIDGLVNFYNGDGILFYSS